MLYTTPLLLAGALFTSATPITKRSIAGPVLSIDFPDPAILKADKWYAYGTQSNYDNKNIHIQIASSSDFNTWSLHQGSDALPSLPSWVDQSNPLVWAPDVLHLVSDPMYACYLTIQN